MGMLYRRGRIRWVKYYRNGKCFRESSKSQSRFDGEQLLRKREGEITTGVFWGLETERVRFEELAQDLSNEYQTNNRKSFVWLKRRINLHLMPFFGGFRAVDVTTERVRAYIIHRQQEAASNGSINRELAALKRMFNLGCEMTPPKLARVPHIPMLRECNVRKGFFEHDQYLALQRELSEYLKPVLTFGYFTGARESEILSLKWNQLDLDQHTVYLEPGSTKNGQPRTIPLTGELLEALKIQKAACDSRFPECNYVFHRKGQRIGNFQREWRSACKRAGVSGRLFHDLRRSAVRNLIRCSRMLDIVLGSWASTPRPDHRQSAQCGSGLLQLWN